jgi:hypothetical protein
MPPDYDSPMRRRLVYLFVVLLLLRGWMGEAMAGQMIGQQIEKAVAAVAVQAADCHGDTHDDGRMADCEACEACSMNALPAPLAAIGAAAPDVPRAQGMASFASAERRAASEPPIA